MTQCEVIVLIIFYRHFLSFVQVSNKKFCNLGLNPLTLEQGLLDEVANVAQKYQHRCDRSKVLPSSFWNQARAEAASRDKARVEERTA